jgi:hypothetical protein
MRLRRFFQDLAASHTSRALPPLRGKRTEIQCQSLKFFLTPPSQNSVVLSVDVSIDRGDCRKLSFQR